MTSMNRSKRGNGLEVFELVVANLAQLGIPGLGIGDLIGLKDVSDALASSLSGSGTLVISGLLGSSRSGSFY